MDQSRIYPYVVPSGYVENQPRDDGLIQSLGHDVYLMLVHDGDGVCRNVLGEELHDASVTAEQLHQTARSNLERLAKGPDIQKAAYKSSVGHPFIVWADHWLAASCLVLPRLHESARNYLGTDDILVSVPQREAMLLFPRADADFRQMMREMILENESDARKPITLELFSLTATGVTPYSE